MGKFVKKPVIVEAEQYFHGKPCKGVKVTNPEIIFSIDGKLFYTSHTDSRDWLSVEKGEDGKHIAYPFFCYEIKSGDRVPIEKRPDLIDLYIKCFEVEYPKPYAWVETIHKGQTVEVQEGEWVIAEPDGIHFYPCKPDIFTNTYEEVKE